MQVYVQDARMLKEEVQNWVPARPRETNAAVQGIVNQKEPSQPGSEIIIYVYPVKMEEKWGVACRYADKTRKGEGQSEGWGV